MKKLLVDRSSGEPIKVKVGDLVFGGQQKLLISGPCSVESHQTMRSIASELKRLGVHMLRGGAFKPRTSPYDFQGLQYEGLEILKAVGEEYNLPIVTEVMDPRDIETVMKYADMIQVGSRNMYNYSLLKELGTLQMPILLKRGISATLSEWLHACEYILSNGNLNVVMCERGIRTFESYTRNTLDLNSVAVIKQKYRLPVVVDPSHGTGLRELVEPMCYASIAAGADGLIVESHTCPDNSVSDARQTISMESLSSIISKVKKFESFFS
jgi:3-deoxy-7-phosphoheptulonate synthase